MSNFFEYGTNGQFKFALSIYEQTIQVKADAKKSKVSDLVELDNWFQNDLPKKIQNRGAEAHITHQELTKTIKWKLERGKFRPRLQELVTSNPPVTVVEQSKKAMRIVRETRDIEASIKCLCTLRGVGPALASAVLAAAAPRQVPFMADECLLSVPSIGRCEYTIKEYVKYVEEMRGCVERLNSTAQGTWWTPHKVELALWAHHVASHLSPDLLDDMPATQVSERREMAVLEVSRVDGCLPPVLEVARVDGCLPPVLEVSRVDGCVPPVLEVSRVDGCVPPVSLGVGEHLLGRGPLLQITDTKVSRKHAKVNISKEGEAAVTALHISPCFVREQGGEWASLDQHQSKRITHNMQIKFTQNLWHYNFSLVMDSAKTTHNAAEDGSNKPSGPNDSSDDIDSEQIQPCKEVIGKFNLNTEADSEPKGIRRLQNVLNKPSHLITKTCDSLTEPETSIVYGQSKAINTKPPKRSQLSEDDEPKGIRNLGKVLTNPSQEFIKKTRESESSKLTTIEPEKSKPIANVSPKKRQQPDWLLKLTEQNCISTLRSNLMKRKLDPEDDNIVVEKDSTAAKSPKRVKKNPPFSSDSSASASIDAPDSGSVGNIQDATNDLPSTDFNKVKSPAKKNKFPVLVTAEDFEDSEDDGETENKVKQKKDTNKVQEARRASCPHGDSCYRKNPIHFAEEAHPGDPDFKDPDEVQSDDDRPECEFGTNCYRKNPDHKRNFKHSHKPQPKRRTKNKKKAQVNDDLDDSFIDDNSEESIDDSDDDEDYEPEINSSQD